MIGTILRLLLRNPGQLFGAVFSMVIVAAIGFNVAFLQTGRHPAPLTTSLRTSMGEGRQTVALPVPKPRAEKTVETEPAPAPAPAKEVEAAKPVAPQPAPASDTAEPDQIAAVLTGGGKPEDLLILEIQTELQSLGFYNGDLDGLIGNHTATAIEAFERASGLSVSGMATEALLARLRGTIDGAKPTAAIEVPEQANDADDDTISVAAHGDPKILAVQRVLSEIGYTPGPLDGVFGRETQDAIQAFEVDRGMEPTGAISDRLIQELEAFTGKPVG